MVIKFIKEHTLFVFVLTICVFLRLIPLFDYQFTLDELSGLDRTRFNSFGELIDKGVKIDAHPALIQVIIYYLSQFFGYINWVIKLPFLLFSFGVVIYAYFFCLQNFSKQVAVIASAIFSFSLVFVFYAPIARMYISGVFFSMALLYYFFEIFFLNNTKRINYVLLGVFALLSALNQHINALFAFTVFASGLFFLNKSNFKAYLITLCITVLAYLPHLPVTLYQLSIGGIGYEEGGWLAKPKLTAVFGFLKILFGTGKTYLIFLALIVFCLIVNRKIKFEKKQLFLLVIFLINFLIVYLYSVYNASIYQNSIMLFSGVAMVILISSLLEVKNNYVFYAVFAVVVSVLVFKTYYKKDYYHQCVKTIFEYQFERTFEYKKTFGDKNVYPIFFDADDVMKGIYFKKYNSSFDFKGSADSVTFSLKHFSRFVADLKTDYLVLASSYPIQQAVAAEYYPYLIENIQTQGINYKLYSKKETDKSKVVEGESVIYSSSVSDKKDFSFKENKEMIVSNNSFSLSVDSTNEYPFDATAPLNKITSKEGQVVFLKTVLKLKNNSSKVSACISINDTKKDTSYFFNSRSVGDFVIKADSSVMLYADSYCGTDYKNIKNKAKCTVFIWNNAKEEFVLKGLEISTIDYWPQKWNFWE
jgi:hypothetical protein